MAKFGVGYKRPVGIKVFRDNKLNQNDETVRFTKEFFVRRFGRDPEHPVEQTYFTEWVGMMQKADPTVYMDSKSKKVYMDMLAKKGKTPPERVWKGKGGISVKIVERDPRPEEKLKYLK